MNSKCRCGHPKPISCEWCGEIYEGEPTPDPDRMRDALRAIQGWVDAYPVNVFPPVDLDAARARLGDDGLFSRLHGEWARHILSGIRRYVEAGLS